MAGRANLAWARAELRDRLIVLDPGGLQLRTAFRGLFTLGAAAGAILSAHLLLPISVSPMIVGVPVSFVANVGVRDPTRRGQAVTVALLPASSAAAFGLSALLRPFPLAFEAGFLALIFSAVAIRRLGPRATSLGAIAFISFFFSAYLQAAPADAPVAALGDIAAALAALLARFLLFPDRPRRALPHVLRAVRVEAAFALREVRHALERGDWTGAARRRLHEDLARLNELALLAETELKGAEFVPAAHFQRVRFRMLHLELAAERVAILALREPGAAAADPALIGAMRAIEAGVRERSLIPAAALAQAGDAQGSDIAARLWSALLALETALADIVEQRAVPVDGAASAEPASPPPPQSGGTVASWSLSPSLRTAIQATIACAIALAAGHLVSEQRWYWAVLTAFIAFARAGSRGDTLVRAGQRVGGTVLGVGCGILIAHILAGAPKIQIALIVAAAFLAFFSFQRAYSVAIFAVTLMIAMVYETASYPVTMLLVVRLEETFVGAAAAMAAAFLLLPTETRRVARARISEFLDGLALAVDRAEASLVGKGRAPLIEIAREVDARFQAVRAAMLPLTFGSRFRTSSARSAIVRAVVCAYWARELCFLGGARPPDALPVEAARLAPSAERVRSRIADLRALLAGASGGEIVAAETTLAETILPQLPGDLRGTDVAEIALAVLDRLDVALADLGRWIAEEHARLAQSSAKAADRDG